MTQDRLLRLLPVAQAKYEAEFATVRHLIAAEGRCRAQLAKLDEMAAQAREQTREPGPMQMLGADVIFEKNIARSRVLLNADLAKVMALKLQAMDKVKLAFGRKHAIELAERRLSDAAVRKRANHRRDAALKPWLDGRLT